MRKLSRLLAAVLSAALVLAGVASAFAAETKTIRRDVMLLVDDTGSMRRNDPNQIATVALQRFVDEIPRTGSRIGMATYSDGIMTDRSIIPIETAQDTELLKQYAQTGLTQRGRYTDLPAALKYAVDQLESVQRLQPSDAQPTIIVVSDGENDYETPEAAAASEQAFEKVINAGIPVYLIVINAQGTPGIREYMDNIAERTGGAAYHVSSGDEIDTSLKQIARTIYDLSLDPDHGIDQVVREPVEWHFPLGEGIFEGNLELTHDSDNLVMQLFGPDGSEIEMREENGIVKSSTAGADGVKTVVKLIEPEAGNYTLVMTSPDAPQHVVGEIVWNYEIHVDVTLSAASAQAGDQISVKAQLLRGTQPYVDLGYANLTASATLCGETTEMTSQSDGFFCDLTVPAQEGEQEVVVTVQGKSFRRSSDPSPLTVRLPSVPTATPTSAVTPVPSLAVSVPPATATPVERLEPDDSGPPFLLIAVLAAVAVAAVALIVWAVWHAKHQNESGGYFALHGTLTVVYYDSSHIFTWEKYVQTGYYARKGKPQEKLGDLLRNVSDPSEIPPCFDTVTVVGLRLADGKQYVEISGKTGTPEEPQEINQRLEIDTGLSEDEFDSFSGQDTVTVVFADHSQAQFRFNL